MPNLSILAEARGELTRIRGILTRGPLYMERAMYPRDPDSGVLEVDCRPLSRSKVMAELQFCMRHGLSFLGQDRDYWRDLLDRPERLLEFAQQLADEADPDEYEMWGVRYLEVA